MIDWGRKNIEGAGGQRRLREARGQRRKARGQGAEEKGGGHRGPGSSREAGDECRGGQGRARRNRCLSARQPNYPPKEAWARAWA